jgi:hypothetical protein
LEASLTEETVGLRYSSHSRDSCQGRNNSTKKNIKTAAAGTSNSRYANKIMKASNSRNNRNVGNT